MVSSVGVKNFRNLRECVQSLEMGVNIIYGDNAQGKTNFLEAVYICATGRSQRAVYDKEMIKFGEKEAYVNAATTEGDHIDVHLKKDQKKGVAINKIPVKKLGELFGHLLVVVFSPEDLKLVKSGPAERRQFMDMELCQLSKVYYYELQQYYKALKQRNKLLKSIGGRKELRDTLPVWDEQLIQHGMKIMSKREGFVSSVSSAAGDIHAGITGEKEELRIQYKPSALRDEYEEKMKRSVERDIAMGSTSVGIHKDDIVFLINGEDARSYGSQGQQRTASLAAKLAEIRIIKESKNRSPVLLLDDVLSELDVHRQKYFCRSIEDNQTLITCTGVEDIVKNLPGDVRLLKMTDGAISNG